MSGPGEPGSHHNADDQEHQPARAAAALRRGQSGRPTWKVLLRRGLALALAGLGIYLVLPSLTHVLASWPRLERLNAAWLAVALAAEIGSFTCYFGLERLALRTTAWFPVVTAGLSGNSISLSVPGGAAGGAAVQYEMLDAAGFDTDTAVAGLTAEPSDPPPPAAGQLG